MGLVAGTATLAAEAVRAVDGLAAGRAERDLGLAATRRAGCREHLAGTAVSAVAATAAAAVTTAAAPAAGAVATAGAVAAAVAAAAAVRAPSSLAAGPTRRTTPRRGEPTLCVEVLLTRGEHELLPAVRAG